LEETKCFVVGSFSYCILHRDVLLIYIELDVDTSNLKSQDWLRT